MILLYCCIYAIYPTHNKSTTFIIVIMRPAYLLFYYVSNTFATTSLLSQLIIELYELYGIGLALGTILFRIYTIKSESVYWLFYSYYYCKYYYSAVRISRAD